MPDIDPITRDALRRASQMQSHTRTQTKREKPIPEPSKPTKPDESSPKPLESGLNALFKDNDRTLILLLIILLMDSEDNGVLLLALFYLLT